MMLTQRLILFTSFLPLALACTKPDKVEPLQALATNAPVIRVDGALMKMMHQGDLSAKASLRDFVGKKGAYGLGALEDLGGEVLIWDGQVMTSVPDGSGGMKVEKGAVAEARSATLLVSTVLERWKEVELTTSIAFKDLDAEIERLARQAGIDADKPFPFRLEGKMDELQWHVIDGSKIPEGAQGHEAHIATAVRGDLNGQAVQILGFFSKHHHAVFTHHDTNTHAHVLAKEPEVVGHVDFLKVPSGTTLYLPLQ